MLTPYGKELRKIRIDRSMTLKTMADGLGFTSAYLSAIESGKRQITEKFFTDVLSFLKATKEEEENLKRARDLSVDNITFSLKNASTPTKETMIAFARRFDQLSDEQVAEINKILLTQEDK